MVTKIKKLKLLFITFIISSIIFTLKLFIIENNKNKSYFSSISLRNLIESGDVSERCKKTDKSFLKKYEKTYQSKEKYKNLNNYQETIIELFRDYNLDTAKNYLKRIWIPLMLIGVDLLFFILWICFCSCLCCPPCCCFCVRKKVTDCVKCSYSCFSIINLFLCLFLLIFSAVGIIKFSNSFKRSINNSACSLYKLSFHFLEGNKEDYPELINWNRWDDDDFNNMNKIINKYYELEEKIKNIPELSKSDCEKNDDCEYYKFIENKIEILNKFNLNFNDSMLKLTNTYNKINELYEVFRKIKNDILDKINDFLTDIFDKYIIICLYGFFGVIGVLSLCSGLIILIYSSCKNDCLKLIFNIIWNIQTLFVISSFLFGIGLNIIGYVGKDLVPIIQYAKSEENLKSEDPFLFKPDNSIIDNLNICLNDKGDIYISLENPKINLNKEEIENKQYELIDKYTNKNITDSQTKLLINYANVLRIADLYTDIEEDFNNLPSHNISTCQFISSDVNITIDQIKETFGNDATIMSYFLLGEDVLTLISIFSGIITINILSRYNYINEPYNLRKQINEKINEKKIESNQERVIRFENNKNNKKVDSSSISLNVRK